MKSLGVDVATRAGWSIVQAGSGFARYSLAPKVHFAYTGDMSKKTPARPVGRPPSSDPRVSSHVPLRESERLLCNAAADRRGLPFATWSREHLLAKAREELSSTQ